MLNHWGIKGLFIAGLHHQPVVIFAEKLNKFTYHNFLGNNPDI